LSSQFPSVYYHSTMADERRGLRFLFNASAEIFVEQSQQGIPARVTELSLRGCFLETSAQVTEQLLRVKIFNENEYFEAPAEVIYTRPSGLGLVFGDMNPHFRTVLQKWILTVLDQSPEQTP
jgi:PilZ domain